MREFTTLDIFISIITIILGIGILTLIIILFIIRPKEIKENKTDDIAISHFYSLNFIDINSFPVYNESSYNLGLAGRLMLDCYTGICRLTDFYYDTENDKIYYNKTNLDYSCSEQCSYNISQACICYIDGKETRGECSRKYDDQYKTGKYCYADNVIYNWKGKKYSALQKDILTYYKDARLKNEECPKGTIDCGIIDDNENKLCVASSLSCPINYLSENKTDSNKTHSTIIIGNKTFYYIYDNTTAIKRKIIAGLVVDTDLYLNKDNDEKDLIDIDTISGFLLDNQNLYKGVNLGYDPYKDENIDDKGNSYLRIFYNKKVDLKDLRNKINTYNSDHKINEEAINPIRKNTKFILIFGLITYISFLIFIIMFLVYRNLKILKYNGLLVLLFIVFYIVSFIYVCINISKFNKLESLDKNADDFPRLINSIIFILYLLLLTLIIFLCAYMFYLREKWRNCSCNICRKNIEVNTTVAGEQIADKNENPIEKNIREAKNSGFDINDNH